MAEQRKTRKPINKAVQRRQLNGGQTTKSSIILNNQSIIFVKYEKVMSTDEIKSEVIKQVESADEALIRLLYEVLKAYKKGFPADEMTPQALLNELVKADQEIDEGNCVTLEELEKEASQW